MKTLLTLVVVVMASQALADSSLAYNKKKVTCVDADELKLTLSADRKTIRLKIRKQDLGKLPITEVVEGRDRGGNYVIYKTSEGELILSDEADTFIDEYQAYFVDCE